MARVEKKGGAARLRGSHPLEGEAAGRATATADVRHAAASARRLEEEEKGKRKGVFNNPLKKKDFAGRSFSINNRAEIEFLRAFLQDPKIAKILFGKLS